MSSRKRKNLNPSESPRTTSKRTRLQQASLQTPLKSISSGPACKYGTSRSAYAINGILDESEDKYLIDWAPGQAGSTWPPDWQIKKNANAAAVKAWEIQKSPRNQETSNRRPRLTLTHKRAEERRLQRNSSRSLTSPTSPTNGRPQPEATGSQEPIVTSDLSQQSVQAISSSVDISNFPDVAVQIEPLGTLDREAYITYSSSLSNQAPQKTAGPHSDSGFEESLSRETSPFHKKREQGIIVPDSQSVPGSSSLVHIQDSSSGCARSPPALSSINPSKSSSGIVIPASQPSKGASERRGSEPVPNLGETTTTPPTEVTSPSLLQTASDPEALRESRRARHFIPRQRPNRRVVIDSPSPSRASPPSHQPEVLWQSIEPVEDITQVQIPGSESQIPFGGDVDLESPVHSPIFATQVPLDHRRQSTQTSSEPPVKLTRNIVNPPEATPDAWQAGQFVPAGGKASSERSADTLAQAKTWLAKPQEVKKVDSGLFDSGKRFDQLHPSQATTADKSNLGTERLETAEQRATNFRSINNLLPESELSESPIDQLPGTIDSRQPPEPPTSSDVDMSENARADGDPPTESRLGEMRRKLQDVQASSDAKLAAQRAERKQSTNGPALPPPAPKQAELEAKTKPTIAVLSPKESDSPSLGRIAVTPKAPLSPNALQSPLGFQVNSPQSIKSPSKIPAKEPYLPQEEPTFLGVDPTEMAKDLPAPMMASQRGSDFVPMSSLHGGESIADDATSTKSDLPTTSLHVQNLGPEEFIMPLSMPPRTQKQYIDTYRFFQRKIALFGEGRDVSRDIVEDLNTMLDRIAKVTTHMDLDGGGPGCQDEVDVTGEAGYAVSVSEKFRFLACVLDFARDSDVHIAIVARPGQLCDFIETTLKAQNINYFRAVGHQGDGVTMREFGSLLNVSILASGVEESKIRALSKKADLIIAFDETFDAEDPVVRALRGLMASHGQLVPVIRLVVYATLEHIHLCLPMSLEPNDRLRKLLYYMVHAEVAVGQLAPENLRQSPFDPSRCAEQLVRSLLAGAIPGSFLPSIPPIENLPVFTSDSSLSDAKSDFSESLAPEDKVRYWPKIRVSKTSPIPRTHGEKRPFDLEYGDSIKLQTKKMKMGTLVGNGRQAGPPEALRDIWENDRIKDLEKQLHYAEANSYEPGNPMSWQSRVNVFEEANRERRELRATVAVLNTTIEKLTLNLATSREEVTTAKAALAEANAKRDTANDILFNNAKPDVQQAELTRRRLEELEAIDAAKTKKLANTENDLDFTRKVYQEASTAASTASSELAALRPRLEAAEAMLASAHQGHKNARAQERLSLQPYLKEKAALKETLKQRDKELQAIKLELDGLKRGRQGVQTRGSSMQPVGARSPRGSRGVSPAVGGLAPGGHGPGHQGGVAMARGPSGLGYSSRLSGAFENGKTR